MCGVAYHPGEPDMRESHVVYTLEYLVVEIVEFSTTVLFDRAMRQVVDRLFSE